MSNLNLQAMQTRIDGLEQRLAVIEKYRPVLEQANTWFGLNIETSSPARPSRTITRKNKGRSTRSARNTQPAAPTPTPTVNGQGDWHEEAIRFMRDGAVHSVQEIEKTLKGNGFRVDYQNLTSWLARAAKKNVFSKEGRGAYRMLPQQASIQQPAAH